MKIEKTRYPLNTALYNIPQYDSISYRDSDIGNSESSIAPAVLILAILLTIMTSLLALYPKNPFTDPYWMVAFGLTIATWIYYYLCLTAPIITFVIPNTKIYSGDEVHCQINIIGNLSTFQSITLTLVQRVSIRTAQRNRYFDKNMGYKTKYPYSEKIYETKNVYDVLGKNISFNIPKQLHPTFKSNVRAAIYGKGSLDLSKGGNFFIEWILTASCKLKSRPTLYFNQFITVHTLTDDHDNETHNQTVCF